MTVRQRAEDELRLANLDLQQFAFVAAHDLQEPARNVSTALGLFNRNYRGMLDADATELIQESIESAKRMHRLIQDLLEFTRTGTTFAFRRNAPVATCTASVLENRSGTPPKAVPKSSALPMLAVQPTHFLQLLQNLVDNAISIAPMAWHLFTSSRRSSGWVFSVADNGIGFDAEFTLQIFGVFKHPPRRRLRRQQNRSRHLRKNRPLLRRRIWAESNLGLGLDLLFLATRFLHRFPLLGKPAELNRNL